MVKAVFSTAHTLLLFIHDSNMADNDTFVTRKDRPYIMGLSIIAVILFHLVNFTNAYRGTSISIFLNGYLGVDAFFVLSTFGLCFSFEKNDILTFYKHRIKRLFPLYVIFLLAVYFIFHPGPSLLHIIIYQCSGLSIIRSLYTDVEWYTPSIICVYLLFPLLYYGGRAIQHRSIWWQLLAVNMIAVLGHAIAPYVSFGYNFVGRFPIIVSGVILYFLYKNKRNQDALIYTTALLLETIALDLSFFLSMLVLLLLFIFKYIKPRPLHKYISFIGKYSFELYLAQTISTYYYMQVSPIQNNYLMVLSAILLTIPIFFIFIAIYKYSSRLFK